MVTSLQPRPSSRRRPGRLIPNQRGIDRPRPPLAPAPEEEGASQPAAWRRTYVRSIVIGDVACALLAAALGFATRFGLEAAPSAHVQLSALWVACALPLVWPVAMLL